VIRRERRIFLENPNPNFSTRLPALSISAGEESTFRHLPFLALKVWLGGAPGGGAQEGGFDAGGSISRAGCRTSCSASRSRISFERDRAESGDAPFGGRHRSLRHPPQHERRTCIEVRRSGLQVLRAVVYSCGPKRSPCLRTTSATPSITSASASRGASDQAGLEHVERRWVLDVRRQAQLLERTAIRMSAGRSSRDAREGPREGGPQRRQRRFRPLTASTIYRPASL
jgi:hypothetical protein